MPIFGKSLTEQWIIRQNEPNAFTILDDQGNEKYRITTRTAATRSYYYLKKRDKELGNATQDPIENKYTISFEGKKTIR